MDKSKKEIFMIKKVFTLILITLMSVVIFPASPIESIVKTGADILISEKLDIIKGKGIGIVTNHTAILSNGTHIADTLVKIDGIKVIALFGPEHGIRGDAAAGEHIKGGIDSKTNIPVYSLYGEYRKPTKDMLKGIDVLIFDIQDVGARFYTYISTLFYTIQSAGENNLEVIILDRPNPIGGLKFDGPILDKKHLSFVGIAPIPIMHGMTVGELANYFVSEKLIGDFPNIKMTVLKMKNWKREMYFDECGLPWLKPSPNIPDLNTAIVYPGTCLYEATNVSEGRGTFEPFLTIGAPFINSEQLIKEIKLHKFSGVSIEPITFTPDSIPNMVNNPKHRNAKCNGIKIKVIDRKVFEPVEFGIILLYSMKKLFKEFELREKSFYRLTGQTKTYEQINTLISPEEIIKSWASGLDSFQKVRQKYLLY